MEPKVTTGVYVYRPLPLTSYQKKLLEATKEFQLWEGAVDEEWIIEENPLVVVATV